MNILHLIGINDINLSWYLVANKKLIRMRGTLESFAIMSAMVFS